MLEEINPTKGIKLFSANSIKIATFIGGPLAFGYMMWKNCVVLKQNKKGKYFLIISILFTIILFLSLFLLPENFIDKVPKYLIPLLYAFGAHAIVEKNQEEILKEHKANKNEFYSFWDVVGVTSIPVISNLVIVLVFIFSFSQNETYDIEMTNFSKNEQETLIFYDYLNTKPKDFLLNELDRIIPKWKENKEIVYSANQFDNLPDEIKKQNKLLLEYCELRIKAFELFEKAINEDSNQYSEELDNLHSQIDKVLEELN